MLNELDCRGLACPAPVIQTKELIEKENPGTVQVMVDNEAARQNVSRFMESRNWKGRTFASWERGIPATSWKGH